MRTRSAARGPSRGPWLALLLLGSFGGTLASLLLLDGETSQMLADLAIWPLAFVFYIRGWGRDIRQRSR